MLRYNRAQENLHMLLLSKSITEQPIMSLRSGSKIGTAHQPLFNPDNLKIIGFHSTDSFSGKRLILLIQDIRDHIDKGFVIDDIDTLADPEDLVRLKELLEIEFSLVGKPVLTDTRKKIGKVNDYAVDSTSFYTQKIYVTQSLIKNFAQGELSVDRKQILKVTDKNIVIKDPQQLTKVKAEQPQQKPHPRPATG